MGTRRPGDRGTRGQGDQENGRPVAWVSCLRPMPRDDDRKPVARASRLRPMPRDGDMGTWGPG
ncbi:MAG: hypothetical protein F6J93_29980 [Oscillatoria sp. SIO1A7]|nr:hypothetical protein [Oscillatoria sp. SIO1A7]